MLLFAGAAPAQEQPRAFRVPFHSVNGMILLDAEVNQKPAVLLLDTGANRTALSASAAGLNISEQARATQANREGNYVVHGVDLKLEQCRWANQQVIVVDLSQRTHMHIEWAAIIGGQEIPTTATSTATAESLLPFLF